MRDAVVVADAVGLVVPTSTAGIPMITLCTPSPLLLRPLVLSWLLGVTRFFSPGLLLPACAWPLLDNAAAEFQCQGSRASSPEAVAINQIMYSMLSSQQLSAVMPAHCDLLYC